MSGKFPIDKLEFSRVLNAKSIKNCALVWSELSLNAEYGIILYNWKFRLRWFMIKTLFYFMHLSYKIHSYCMQMPSGIVTNPI